MSVLGEIKTKKVILPSSAQEKPEEQDWCTVNVKIPAKDMLGISEGTDEEKTYAILAKAIVDWSFTTSTGEKAEITPENISLLPAGDLVALNEALGFTADLITSKKNN